jgi:hypothetical protein
MENRYSYDLKYVRRVRHCGLLDHKIVIQMENAGQQTQDFIGSRSCFQADGDLETVSVHQNLRQFKIDGRFSDPISLYRFRRLLASLPDLRRRS